MTRIEVALGERSYGILIEDGILDRAGAHLTPLSRDNRLIIVSDETVWAAQGPRLTRGLGAIEAVPILLPPGEGTKSWAGLSGLIDRLLCLGVERGDYIVAFGGGVVGDLAGFAAARLRGEDNADAIRAGPDGEPVFLSNHAGGVAGGISTGQPVIVRVAFKPTSSILTPVPTIDSTGAETEIVTTGRHDPCVGIRGAPVAEAMMALVLADQKLLHRAQDRKSTRLNSSHRIASRMPSSA